MSVADVKKDFEEKHADIEIFKMDDSGATVEEAAKTIGIDEDSVAKTLSFHLDDKVLIVVMSGNSRIDNRKYKDMFHSKAKMLSADEVEPLTGHPVGGVCPFGLKGNPTICLDESLRRHKYVYPAAGSRYYAFKIDLESLEKLTNAQWVDVCK